jgi:hypothetical protein
LKALWIGGHALSQGVNRFAEMPPESGVFAFTPILRVDQFRTRGLGEDDREHYGQRCASFAFNADKVTPSARS